MQLRSLLACLGLLAGLWTAGLVAQSPGEGLSLYEQRLLRLIERAQVLEARAFAETTEPDDPDIKRQFQELAREFESVVADNPDQVEALIIYGKFLALYGDREGAHLQFSRAYRLDSNLAVVHQQLGTYLAEEGNPAEALPFFLRAVQLEPEQAAYHYGLGELLSEFREPLLAREVFSAETLERQMLEAFRNAAERAPDVVTLQMRYGEAFYDVASPDWNQALAQWERVAKLELSATETEVVRLHRARALLELGRVTEARVLLDDVSSTALQATKAELLARAVQPASTPAE